MPPLDPTEADAPHELIATGRAARLAELVRTRLAEAPGDWGAGYLHFAALSALGRPAEAMAALDQARTLQGLLTLKDWGADLDRLRSDSGYAADLGTRLYGAGHVALACIAYRAALDAGSTEPAILLSHALSLQHQGRAEEAVEAFRSIGARFQTAAAEQFMLPALFAAEDGTRRHAVEARRWAARHAPPGAALPVTNGRAGGRPLRVGYVAPSFAQGQARQFICPSARPPRPRGGHGLRLPQSARGCGRLQGAGADARARRTGRRPGRRAGPPGSHRCAHRRLGPQQRQSPDPVRAAPGPGPGQLAELPADDRHGRDGLRHPVRLRRGRGHGGPVHRAGLAHGRRLRTPSAPIPARAARPPLASPRGTPPSAPSSIPRN